MSVYAINSDDDSWEEFHREIDRRLDAIRPEYTTPKDRTWQAPVIGWARNHIPNEAILVRHVADDEVRKREREATKRANSLVRDFIKGVVPLDNAMLGPLPIRVNALMRVRLDVTTPLDMEDAARFMLSNATKVYSQVQFLTEGMMAWAAQARAANVKRVFEFTNPTFP